MTSPNLLPGQIVQPVMRRIPEGWISMGCAAGRDDEMPVHRVWVDPFELAAYQTTNEDYACFLKATRHPKPSPWDDPNFNHPNQPVVAVSWFEAVAYCEWMSRVSGLCYRLPTEAEWNTRRAAGRKIFCIRGAIASLQKFLTIPCAGNRDPNRWDFIRQTRMGFSTLGTTCTNGARIGMARITTPHHLSEIRKAQRPEIAALLVAALRHHIKVTRIAARSSIPPELKYADYGFRVARSLEPPH